MKILKIQTEMLKARLKGTDLGCDDTVPGKVAVCMDGAVAYLLDADSLYVRTDGTRRLTFLTKSMAAHPEVCKTLYPTDQYVDKVKFMARKYLFDNDPARPVWYNPAKLKNFDAPVLVQAEYKPLGLATVAEMVGGTLTAVGCILPVVVKE